MRVASSSAATDSSGLDALASTYEIAFAFKPFALFFLPCVLVALWPRSGPLIDRVRRVTVLGGALLAPAAITMAPFLIWNADAYVTDTISFVAGTIPGVYRIQGYSLASLLLALHVIPSPDARFPFGLLQGAVAAPVLAVASRSILSTCWTKSPGRFPGGPGRVKAGAELTASGRMPYTT